MPPAAQTIILWDALSPRINVANKEAAAEATPVNAT
jgi:hypothetical protein